MNHQKKIDKAMAFKTSGISNLKKGSHASPHTSSSGLEK